MLEGKGAQTLQDKSEGWDGVGQIHSGGALQAKVQPGYYRCSLLTVGCDLGTARPNCCHSSSCVCVCVCVCELLAVFRKDMIKGEEG